MYNIQGIFSDTEVFFLIPYRSSKKQYCPSLQYDIRNYGGLHFLTKNSDLYSTLAVLVRYISPKMSSVQSEIFSQYWKLSCILKIHK